MVSGECDGCALVKDKKEKNEKGVIEHEYCVQDHYVLVILARGERQETSNVVIGHALLLVNACGQLRYSTRHTIG